MTGKELSAVAAAFADEPTFYEYGGWGQEMTLATLNALVERRFIREGCRCNRLPSARSPL